MGLNDTVEFFLAKAMAERGRALNAPYGGILSRHGHAHRRATLLRSALSMTLFERLNQEVLRQREEWIPFSYSNEDTKDEERRKGRVIGRRLNVIPSAKRTPCPRTTPQQEEL
jgi:hypothetical protein